MQHTQTQCETEPGRSTAERAGPFSKEDAANEAAKHLGLYNILAYKAVQAGIINSSEVDDVVQEMYLRVFTTLQSANAPYDPQKGKISTWVRRPCSWAVLDYVRTQRRQSGIADEFMGSCIDAHECEDDQPRERRSVEVEEESEFASPLRLLTDKEAEAVRFAHRDITPDNAAAAVGIGAPAMRKRLRSAELKLQAWLQECLAAA